MIPFALPGLHALVIPHGLLPTGMSAAVLVRTESNPSETLLPRPTYHGSGVRRVGYRHMHGHSFGKLDEMPYLCAL